MGERARDTINKFTDKLGLRRFMRFPKRANYPVKLVKKRLDKKNKANTIFFFHKPFTHRRLPLQTRRRVQRNLAHLAVQM